MKKKAILVFRPGSLGDQIVTYRALSGLDFDDQRYDLVLLEKKRVSAAGSNASLFKRYSTIWQYDKKIELIALFFTLVIRYGRLELVYISYSQKPILKAMLEILLLAPVSRGCWSNLCAFAKSRARTDLVINEYDRNAFILKSVFSTDDGGVRYSERFDLPLIRKLGASKRKLFSNFVFICPFTGWESKNLPMLTWVEVIGSLLAEGYEVGVLVQDQCAGDEIAKHLPASLSIFSGVALTEIHEMISVSAGLITLDTSIMHLCADAEVPIVAIFSDVNRRECWTPRAGKVFIIRDYVRCGGCFSPVCLQTRHLCMMKITADRISNAFTKSRAND